jgi:serine/threonine-protein kinase RsbW
VVISDGHQYEMQVRIDLAGLEGVFGLLDEIWQAHGLPFEIQADLNISVEEILSNVIRHGSASQPIEMRIVVRPENITIELQDRGISFDPLCQAPPDVTLPLEQRRAGGLGIFMVTRMMDKVSYERRQDVNCFTMVKVRTAQPG